MWFALIFFFDISNILVFVDFLPSVLVARHHLQIQIQIRSRFLYPIFFLTRSPASTIILFINITNKSGISIPPWQMYTFRVLTKYCVLIKRLYSMSQSRCYTVLQLYLALSRELYQMLIFKVNSVKNKFFENISLPIL